MQAQADSVINNPGSSENDRIIAQQQANTKIKENDAAANTDLYKTREDFRLKDLNAQYDIDNQRIQSAINTTKAISDSDEKSV